MLISVKIYLVILASNKKQIILYKNHTLQLIPSFPWCVVSFVCNATTVSGSLFYKNTNSIHFISLQFIKQSHHS